MSIALLSHCRTERNPEFEEQVKEALSKGWSRAVFCERCWFM